jgi:hypothetical protein
MNKRFLSTLLTGAIFLAATSMFVSCKDYDDDIKNLQAQIDKAALKSEVEALQATLSQVQANAATKAELAAAKSELAADIKKAQETADAAGQKAAQAISDAAKAQNAADAAQSFAEAVKLTADAAKALAETNKADLATAKKELTGLITDAQETADAALALAQAAATKADFDAAVEKLTKAAADAQATADEALKIAKAAATKADFDAAVEKLTKAAADAQAAADAAQADVDALEEIAATKDELAAVKGELEEYAREVADQAKGAAVVEAKAAIAEQAAKQAGIDAAQDAAVAAALENYATNATIEALAASLNEQLDELKDAISKTATEAAFEILSDEVKAYGAQIDVLFCAVSSVELFASYSYSYKAPSVDGQLFYGADSYATSTTDVSNAHLAYTTITIFGTRIRIPNGVTVDVDVDTEVNTDIWAGIAPLTSVIFHGTVPEDSKFGDNEDFFGQKADKEIEYKKGADVKDEAELIVRVNPVNADITSADIRLINSLGEDLNDVFVVTKAERYNQLITRGATINSGLWKLTLKAADGLTEEAYEDAVFVKENEDIVAQKKFAVAINNTVKDNADRFVASTFDFIPVYAEFEPAKEFTFKVNDKSVENVRNRWTFGRYDQETEEADLYIMSEMQYDRYYDNPELAWHPEVDNAPTAEPILKGDNTNVVIDGNVYTWETRRYQTFVYADVNEPIVLSDFFGIGEFEYPGQQIEYYYVVFDKGNAIESAPSEWNAWKDYTVEGLGKMTKADEKLTMMITSEEAHGDVVGFRVFAVNRDGSLADPDGRAFYVFVGKPGEDNRAESANIIATEEQPESEEMDIAGWFKAGRYYYFSTVNFSGKNENPAWITEGPTESEFIFDNAILTFYDKDGEALDVNFDGGYVSGDDIKDAVKVTFKPNDNIASMLNGATYTIYISQSEVHAGDYLSMPYATLAITKVMPTEGKTLEFRPKQEGEWNDKGVWTSKDGTGKFLAYMIPNTNLWQTPWATTFTESYVVGDDPRDNGFKDLNNIFYNLNNDTTFEFVFSTSLLAENGGIIDLVDENGEGVMYGKPGTATRPELAEGDMPYVLDVATDFIDYKTEHAVQVYSNYFGVSTYYDKDGNIVFGENWKVEGQQFTAIYGCWHHAMHDIKFKNAITLQWSHEGTETTTTLSNIETKNYYNSTYFGKPLDQLIANGWLVLDTDKAPVLSTQPNAKGQINPYFVPTLNGNNGITFNQKGTQVDANPTADHPEYLNIYLKDAFGHEVIVSSQVTIKKAASNAPAL